VHKRSDPLAAPSDAPSILYEAFTDYPDKESVIVQECRVEDLWMEVSTLGLAGLSPLNEGRLRLMQEELNHLLVVEMEKRAQSKPLLYVQQFKREMLEASAIGARDARHKFSNVLSIVALFSTYTGA
jgi:hypothetical protein